MPLRSGARLAHSGLFSFAFAIAWAVHAPSADACAPSEWQVDDTDAPSCVQLSLVGAGRYELTNDCAEELTLGSDCASCTVPASVASMDVAVIELSLPSEQDVVEVDLVGAQEMGSVGFSFYYNRCPDQGCAATPVGGAVPPSALWLGALVFVAWHRRRHSR